MPNDKFHSGYVAIVGRPNVGKSSLLNRLLGQKISITSPRPQTTRHRILGIKTTATEQVVYVDTPGLHKNVKTAINRYMNRTVAAVMGDVDLILFVIEALKWTDEDEQVLSRLKKSSVPVMLIINKTDTVKDKAALLPFMEQCRQHYEYIEIIPVSAMTGDQLDELQAQVQARLPQGVPYFPEEQITDKTERFLVAEIIREKLVRRLRQELPYTLTVEIEGFNEDETLLQIDALIWVERDSQKKIVIGKQGVMLKEIGRQARLELEKMYDKKVHLKLWVKVKEGWTDNERSLKNLGFREDT